MLFAAIDIGSNAGRLLIANVYNVNNIISIEKESLVRVPLRLGNDTFINGKIGESKIEDIINSFKSFAYLLKVYKPVAFKACATSAMREASNSDEVIDRVFKETGIQIHIIDGDDEAKYVFANHSSKQDPKTQYVYIDVGGGSTEITIVYNNKQIATHSFKIGTIRSINDAEMDEEFSRMKKFIKSNTDKYFPIECVGSGGNINKLSNVFSEKGKNTLSYQQLKKALDYLSSFTLEERIIKVGLRPDRADVIIPAAKIYLKAMKWAEADIIQVPKIGLADGIIHELYDKVVKGIR
ncbi:MAG: exopolyphosphatase [Bacteroidota bacterium]